MEKEKKKEEMPSKKKTAMDRMKTMYGKKDKANG